MRGIGIKKQRIARAKMMYFFPVPIADFALEHINRFDAAMLKGGKYIRRFGQCDQIGLDNHAAGVGPDMACLLYTSPSPRD